MRKAFTLIELLVVIAIISILATILLPSLSEAKRLAQLTQCKSQMRVLGVASTMYANETSGGYPSGAHHNWPMRGPIDDYFGEQLREYSEDNVKVFCCPLSDRREGTYVDYALTFGLNRFHSFAGVKTQTYMYFGNYSREVSVYGLGPLFSPQEVRDIQAGVLYPRDNSSGRAKLFQDIVSDHNFETTNHDNPNSLYTDGSVEQGPDDPYSLPFHVRWAGANYWW